MFISLYKIVHKRHYLSFCFGQDLTANDITLLSEMENANQEQRAEMLAPSRWAPPAAGQVWEISASSEAPEGTSLVAT